VRIAWAWLAGYGYGPRHSTRRPIACIWAQAPLSRNDHHRMLRLTLRARRAMREVDDVAVPDALTPA
jgi:hypothetical protein